MNLPKPTPATAEEWEAAACQHYAAQETACDFHSRLLMALFCAVMAMSRRLAALEKGRP